MKKIFIPLMLLLFCCQTENKDAAVFPEVYEGEPDWIVYEGIVPLESGEEINVELSIRPGSPGYDADYKLDEWNPTYNTYIMGRHSSNKYTTLMSANPDEVIIQLHESRINRELFFGDTTPAQLKKLRASADRTTELYFKTKGNELILVDRNFKEVDAQKYSLIRRSKTFTVEGYITFVNDTSDFFEMNTRETWQLNDRGMFNMAKATYKKLAKEKFEGIYLKGIGYSVDHTSASGENTDALVLRKIYEMRPGNPIKP